MYVYLLYLFTKRNKQPESEAVRRSLPGCFSNFIQRRKRNYVCPQSIEYLNNCCSYRIVDLYRIVITLEYADVCCRCVVKATVSFYSKERG